MAKAINIAITAEREREREKEREKYEMKNHNEKSQQNARQFFFPSGHGQSPKPVIPIAFIKSCNWTYFVLI